MVAAGSKQARQIMVPVRGQCRPARNSGPPAPDGQGLPARAVSVLHGLALAADAAHACLLSNSRQQSPNVNPEIHMTSAHTSARTLNSGTSLQAPRTALIVAGVVLCLALLSVYGHLVQSRVKRGETLREAQRAGLYAVTDGSLLRPARAPSAHSVPLSASASLR